MNKEIKNYKGITLVALVITVIVLLILAGVSITALNGKDGLLSNTETAAQKAKISKLQEKLNLELIELQLESSTGNITVDKYLNKLQQKDIIDESDVEDSEEGKQIVVDGEFIFIVDEDSDGKVKIEYLGKVGAIKPSIKLVNISKTTNTITVEVSTKRNEDGKIQYYYKLDTDDKYTLYKETENTTCIYEKLEQNKTYNLKIVAVAQNGQIDEVLVDRITGSVIEIKEGDITFEFDEKDWTNKDVTVTAKINIDITGFTLQTSKDGSKWDDTASQTFEENGTIYARVIDSDEQYNGLASTNVEKIDMLDPNEFIPTAESTLNTITVTASTTDQEATTKYGKSDIAGYRFRVNSGEWSDYQASGTYPFTGLSQATSYKVEVEAKDNAGNTTPGEVTISTKEVTLSLEKTEAYYSESYTTGIRIYGDNLGALLVSSSDSAVAEGRYDGGEYLVIHTKASGKAVITVTPSNNINKAVTFTVYVTSLTAPSTTAYTVEIGKTLTLTEPTKSEYAGDITYTSNNESVATVTSSGTVTAVAAGTATITAREANGEATVKYTITVPKNQLLATKLTNGELKKGDYVNYPVNYTNVDRYCGRTSTLTGWRVLYKSEECIYLVSGGCPYSYKYNGSSSITNLYNFMANSANCSSFKDTIYASQVRSLSKYDLEYYLGSTLRETTAYSDDVINPGGGYYLCNYYQTGTSIWVFCNSNDMFSSSSHAASECGIRVVVKLNSNVRTTGKDSSGVWQLTTATGN